MVGASGGNGFGIVGVAPGSTVVPMRLGSSTALALLGSSNEFRNEALRYAAEQRFHVVTASWVVPLGAALTQQDYFDNSAEEIESVGTGLWGRGYWVGCS